MIFACCCILSLYSQFKKISTRNEVINYNGRTFEYFVVDPFFCFLRADNSMIIDEIIEKFDKKIVQIFPIFIPIGDRNYSYVLKFVELLLQLKL